MRRAHLAIAVTCLTGIAGVVGCARGSTDLATTESSQDTVADFTSAFAPCPEGPADGPDPFEFLAVPGAWYVISTADAEPATEPAAPSTLWAEARAIGGDLTQAEPNTVAPAGSPQQFHGSASMTELIEQALGASQEMYLKAEPGAGVPALLQAVAFDASGDFAFVGECYAERISEPLHERFGAETASVVRSLIGADSPTTRDLLSLDDPVEEPESQPILNPQFTDPAILDRLEQADFTLESPPESWVASYTICPRITAGWSTCVDLMAQDTHGVAFPIYYDPAQPTVELWLTDDNADLTRPLVLLGAIDLTPQIQTSGSDGDRTRITMTLPEGITPTEASELDGPVEGVSITAEAGPR
jgi:hypothetical protein